VAFYGLDVVGRGILATLLAFSIHNLVSVIGRAGDGSALPPDEVISALQARYSTKGSPAFSMVYGTIDSSSGEYRISQVGRMPVLQLTSRGKFCKIECGETGQAEVRKPVIAQGVLARGDRLAIASSGLMGVFGREYTAALKNFEKLLEEYSGESSTLLVDTVRKHTEKEGPRAEDACLLVIERRD
jgi:hypothetical protein